MAGKVTVKNYEVKEITNPRLAPGTEAGLLEKRITGDPVIYADPQAEADEVDKNIGKIDISAPADISDEDAEEKAKQEVRNMLGNLGLESGEDVPVELEPVKKDEKDEKRGRPARPDNELPGGGRPKPDNELPDSGGSGRPDNKPPETAKPKPSSFQPPKKK